MASRGVNRVHLLGHVGRDPERRETPTGTTVTNLSVATSEQWKDKQTGEARENTEWHRVVIFGKLADVAADYLSKGSQVYLEGKIQTRKWQDQSGNDRYSTEVVANEMKLIGGSGGVGPGSKGGYGGQHGDRHNPEPEPQQAGSSEPSGGGPVDDDVPFGPIHVC